MTRKYIGISLPLLVVIPLIWSDAGLFSQEESSPGQRLKRKNRGPSSTEVKPKGENPNQEPAESKKEDKGAKFPDEDRLIPENRLPREQDDEIEVLERVEKNMRLSEEKLSNQEWGEATTQIQRDIIQDLESLLKSNEGGGKPPASSDQEKSKEQSKSNDQKSDSRDKSEKGQTGKGPPSTGKRQAGRRAPRQLRTERNSQEKNSEGKRLSNQSKPLKSGNQPSSVRLPDKPSGDLQKGDKSPSKMAELNTEIIKDIWGHLPESVRAEMDAYSNPQPFHPRYDRLIREYYKTIAESGRKKGE